MKYIDKKIEENINELILVLQNFIKIDTRQAKSEYNAPFGKGNKEAIEYLITLAKKFNLKYFNLDNYLCWIEIGSGKEMIGIPVHLDVVPVNEDDWTVGAFEGILKEGHIYGRGAVDNKGPAVIMLFLLKILNENKEILLKKRIRVIFGTNEETGMKCIKYYKKMGGEEPVFGFTPDAMYPIVIGEKGMLHLVIEKKIEQLKKCKQIIRFNGGSKSNIVPEKSECIFYNFPEEEIEKLLKLKNEKLVINKEKDKLHLQYLGESCHASNPEKGINSIAYLSEIITNNVYYDNEGLYEINNFYKIIGKKYYGENCGLYTEDKIFGKLTINLGILNITENSVYAEIDIRYPHKITENEIIETLKEKFGKEYIIREENKKPIHYVDKNLPFVQKLMEVYLRATNREEEYLIIGGGTYASYFKNMVGFGPKFKEIRTGGHGKDERISIEALKINMKIYYEAIISLLEL